MLLFTRPVAYFVCVGRHQKRTNCTMSAINIHGVERQVENLYKLVALSPEGAAMTRSRLKATMEAGAAEAKRTQKTLITQQTRLMERSKKLLDGHLDGTIPSHLYREEQERINREMAAVADRLNALQTEFEVLEQNLYDAIALAGNCYEAYRRAPDALRRTYNQAFFTRILITRDESIEGELAQPFATIIIVTETTNGASPEGEAPFESGSYNVICSKETDLVEVARQCSNLAPALQLAVSSHRAIRRRRRPAPVSPTSARALPRPVPRLTVAMLGEAERRYKDGEILRAIAGDLGVSRQRLAVRLRERGVRLRGEKPSSEQVREMCLRYEQGESLATVGERMGFNASSVRVALIAAGVMLRDTNGRVR